MLSFTVHGNARPAGSKRIGTAGGKKGGRPIIFDSAKGGAAWRADVRSAAALAAERHLGIGERDWPIHDAGTALAVSMWFYVPRPRTVRREFPTVKPDVLKLARAIEDALTGLAWQDDAQIVAELVCKAYGGPERVEVSITEVL